MSETSFARKGFNLLMKEFPHAEVLKVWYSEPWLSVDLKIDGKRSKFAIWRATGCVYRLDPHGAAPEDPMLIPSDSPYLEGK